MASKYEETVAQMAEFNEKDESAEVAGKEEFANKRTTAIPKFEPNLSAINISSQEIERGAAWVINHPRQSRRVLPI